LTGALIGVSGLFLTIVWPPAPVSMVTPVTGMPTDAGVQLSTSSTRPLPIAGWGRCLDNSPGAWAVSYTVTPMAKLFMIAPVTGVASVAPPSQVEIRSLDEADLERQAEVIRTAFLGTPDAYQDSDDGADAQAFWAAEWGEPIRKATYGAFVGNELVGLSYVCVASRGPLVGVVAVIPDWTGRRVGAALVSASAAGLVGEYEALTLAVIPDNIGALRLYVGLGFRLYADGCLEVGAVRYTELSQFEFIFNSFEQSLPGVELPVTYGVQPYLNRTVNHRLAGWILLVITGYRGGVREISMTPAQFDLALALLRPAGAATIFDHPNLQAWESIRAAGEVTGLTEYVAQFGELER
jgi:GNAT superfamily N-acetyltransferase